MKRKLRGFTLIELLVVVSIIALLISILLPSLKNARDQAKLTVCMSNLKQLALAFGYYGEDFSNRPPPNRLRASPDAPYGGTPPDFRDSDWWYYFHMVPKYVPSNKRSQTNAAFGGVFECPSDKAAGRAYSMNVFAGNFEKTEPFATQYVRGEPFNPFSVRRAHLYLLLGEAHAIFADAENSGLYGTRYIIGQEGSSVYRKFMKVSESADRGPFTGYIDFKKHRRNANFLFCDSHVETLRSKHLVKEDEERPGRWISTLRVQWSPQDPEVNLPSPP
jgi:prepilin-type N-terminal cleavage/methylation domain-containing protein/prepilin-type processing-associated H-X9-DG protein